MSDKGSDSGSFRGGVEAELPQRVRAVAGAWRWLRNYIGSFWATVLIALFILIAGFFTVQFSWNTFIQTRAGTFISRWFGQHLLPRASANLFTIAVARLEDDADLTQQKIIVSKLDTFANPKSDRNLNVISLDCAV